MKQLAFCRPLYLLFIVYFISDRPWPRAIFTDFHRVVRLTTSLFLVGLIPFLVACRADQSIAGRGAPQAAQTIENKGSDTLVNLALAWAEMYMASHPEVRISVTGGGSGTGIAAMINGTVDIANASRAMKPEEISAAILLTEWPEFAQLDWGAVRDLMDEPRIVFDGRNALDADAVRSAGLSYAAIGREGDHREDSG